MSTRVRKNKKRSYKKNKRKTRKKCRKKKRRKKKRKKKMYRMLRETYKPKLLNIYNEELQPCGNMFMGSGSWDDNYMCSEKDGGVHQICVDRIGTNTNKFSKNTGQSDWSTSRGNNNHCVCLGAWSLYNWKRNNNKLDDTNSKKLKCDAIPNYSLTNDYVKKFVGSNKQGWEEWNNNEEPDQIVDGVESMFDECYRGGNTSQKLQLLNNYCNFARNIPRLNNTNTFHKFC